MDGVRVPPKEGCFKRPGLKYKELRRLKSYSPVSVSSKNNTHNENENGSMQQTSYSSDPNEMTNVHQVHTDSRAIGNKLGQPLACIYVHTPEE